MKGDPPPPPQKKTLDHIRVKTRSFHFNSNCYEYAKTWYVKVQYTKSLYMYLLLVGKKQTIPELRKRSLPVLQGRGVWCWVPEAL